MTDSLITFLLALSRRERWLLTLLVGVVLPLAVVVFWILPLSASRSAADADLAEAQLTYHWVQARAAEARALAPAGTAAPVAAPIGISGVEQSLIRAGLRGLATRLSNRDRAAIDLSFDAVPFDLLASWLSGEIPASGYRIANFRFEAAEVPGIVAAAIVLEPRQ